MNTERSCSLPPERLTAWLLGELSSDEVLEVERHLASCEQCRSDLEEIRSTLEAIGEALREEKLEETLRPERRAVLSGLRRRRRVPIGVTHALAWAASIALTLGAYWWYRSVGPNFLADRPVGRPDTGSQEDRAAPGAPAAASLPARRAASPSDVVEVAHDVDRAEEMAAPKPAAAERKVALRDVSAAADQSGRDMAEVAASSPALYRELERHTAATPGSAADVGKVVDGVPSVPMSVRSSESVAQPCEEPGPDQRQLAAAAPAMAVPRGRRADVSLEQRLEVQADGRAGMGRGLHSVLSGTNVVLGKPVRTDRHDLPSERWNALTNGERKPEEAIQLPTPTRWIELDVQGLHCLRGVAVWYQPVGMRAPVRAIELSETSDFAECVRLQVGKGSNGVERTAATMDLSQTGVAVQRILLPGTRARYVRLLLEEDASRVRYVEVELFGEPCAVGETMRVPEPMVEQKRRESLPE